MSEKLEFSAEDLGRLAWEYGTIGPLYVWLARYAVDRAEDERVRVAAERGYSEARGDD